MNEPFIEHPFDPLAPPSYEGIASFEGIHDATEPLDSVQQDSSDDMVFGGHLTELGALVFCDDATALGNEFAADHLETCAACRLAVEGAQGIVNVTSIANRSLDVPTFRGLTQTPESTIDRKVVSLDEARARKTNRLSGNKRTMTWLSVAAGVIGFTALGGSLLNRNSPTTQTSDLAVDTRSMARTAKKPEAKMSVEKDDTESAFAAETSVAAAAGGELSQADRASELEPAAPAAAAPEVLGDVPQATTALPASGSAADGSGIIREANEPTTPKPGAAKRPSVPPVTVPATAPVTTLVPGETAAPTLVSPEQAAVIAAPQPPPPTFPRSFATIADVLNVLTQQPQLFGTLSSSHPCGDVLRPTFGLVPPADIRFIDISLDGNPVVLAIAQPDTVATATTATTLLGNWQLRLATPSCRLMPLP